MFYKKILLLLLPLVALVATINFTVDPAHLFEEGKYERQMANILLKGYNVTNVTNYDERLLQKFFICGLKKAPDNVVFGSSRVMLIDSSFLDNQYTINNAVSGGTMQDYLALYNLYLVRKIKPKHIYLGIDPWLLNQNIQDDRWRSIATEYFQMLKLLHLEQFEHNYPAPLLKWKEILSVRYFQTSFKSLAIKPIERCTNRMNIGITRLKDGTITYDKTTRTGDSLQVNQKSYDFIKHDQLNFIENFEGLSNKNMLILTKFIAYLKKENTRITFVLTPYHKIVYTYIVKHQKYAAVLESEKKFRAFAAENHIEIFGSFNPEKCSNISNKDFYDGVHLNEEGMKKIF